MKILFIFIASSIISTVIHGQSKGQQYFETHCSSCHNFTAEAIGPQLGGLKQASLPSGWLNEFVKNPKKIIDSADERALLLYKKYKVLMPAFDYLSDDEINEIVAYILTKPAPKPKKQNNKMALADPIPPKIELSDIVLKMEPYVNLPKTNDKKPFTRLIKMEPHPVTGLSILADLQGKLYEIKEGSYREFFDFKLFFPNFINNPGLATGFGSFAFHPDFRQNGLFYTTHSEKAGSAKSDFTDEPSVPVKLQWVVTEWYLGEKTSMRPFVNPRELLRIDMASQIHGMQEIAFNPNAKPGTQDYGKLYIGIGDGGAVGLGHGHITHSKSRIHGTVLRIDPLGRNSKNGKYGIVADNPFKKPGELKEIYAYGFRNPHRMSWTKDNKMLVANVGQTNMESLYWVKAGSDAGWPLREGTVIVDKEDIGKVYKNPNLNDGFNYPIAQYDHDEGNAIHSGFEYIGQKIPALKGKFIFGDIVKGRLFYIHLADIKAGKQAKIYEWQVAMKESDNSLKITALKDLTKTDKVDYRYGFDANNEPYILTKPNGMIYRIFE